jgi:hypothetical protein
VNLVPDAEPYATIRQIIGSVIGRRIVDVTQQDQDEWDETKQAYVMLHLDDGSSLKFPVGDEGFEHDGEPVEIE